MSKSKPPQDSKPADKTQVLGSDAVHQALASGAENPAGQSTSILPTGLPMLEPLPPLSEEPTQPLRLVAKDPAEDAEAEVQAILNGPDATVRLQAGPPTAPPESGATVSLPILPLATPYSTQVLPVTPPPVPQAAEPQLPHPDVRTMEISRSELPTPNRRRMPLWGWAALGTMVLLLGLGSIYALRPELLGLGNSETKTEDPAAAEANPSEPGTTPSAQSSAEPVPEIPPALRSYYDKAEKGDPAAMRMLGVMYYNGLNVPKNEREGLKWYRKAAKAGSKAAQKELKQMGIDPDPGSK